MGVRASPASMLLPFWADYRAAATLRQIEVLRLQQKNSACLFHAFRYHEVLVDPTCPVRLVL